MQRKAKKTHAFKEDSIKCHGSKTKTNSQDKHIQLKENILDEQESEPNVSENSC